MRSTLGGIVLFSILGLVVQAGFAADEKKDDKKPEPDKKDTPEKLIKQGQLPGKILSIDETKKSIKFQLSYSLPKLNENEYRAYVQAQVDYARALAKKDLNGVRNAMNSMAQHQRNLYTYEQKTKDLDLQTIDDVVVRLANPPPAFDDKGHPKKYTKKELDELKGPNKKLPGYEAEFSSLRGGQTAVLYLVKKKDDKKEPMPKPKTKEELEEAMLANLPQVSMILIVVEPKD